MLRGLRSHLRVDAHLPAAGAATYGVSGTIGLKSWTWRRNGRGQAVRNGRGQVVEKVKEMKEVKEVKEVKVVKEVKKVAEGRWKVEDRSARRSCRNRPARRR